MSRMNRRKLIAGVGALSVASAIPALSQIDEACDFAWMTEDGLLHASLFAPIPAEASPDHACASKVDVWTFRVSEIDCSSLPSSVGRIIVWDEVFSPRSLRGSVQAMIDAVADWYDLEPGTADWSLHIHGLGEISVHSASAARVS